MFMFGFPWKFTLKADHMMLKEVSKNVSLLKGLAEN